MNEYNDNINEEISFSSTISSLSNLSMGNTLTVDSYKIIFEDSFSIDHIYLKDLFKLFIKFIGAKSVKSLNIKIGNTDLISYSSISDSSVQYPIIDNCYLYIEMPDNVISNTIYEICQKLDIRADLKRGSCFIFKRLNQKSANDSLVKNVAYYTEQFYQMKVSKYNDVIEPNKAIMLLAIFQIIRSDKTDGNQIRFTPSLSNIFNFFWREYVSSDVRFVCNAATSFMKLCNESFIKFSLKSYSIGLPDNAWTQSLIDEYCDYISIDPELFNLIKSDDSFKALVNALTERFNLVKRDKISSDKSLKGSSHKIIIEKYNEHSIVVYGNIKESDFFHFRDMGGFLTTEAKFGICWILDKVKENEIRSIFGDKISTTPRVTRISDIKSLDLPIGDATFHNNARIQKQEKTNETSNHQPSSASISAKGTKNEFNKFLSVIKSSEGINLPKNVISDLLDASGCNYIKKLSKSHTNKTDLFSIRDATTILRMVSIINKDVQHGVVSDITFYMIKCYLYFIEEIEHGVSVSSLINKDVDSLLSSEHYSLSGTPVGFYSIRTDSFEVKPSNKVNMLVSFLNYIGPEKVSQMNLYLNGFGFVVKTREIENYRNYSFLNGGYWVSTQGSIREIGSLLELICKNLNKFIEIKYLYK